MQFFSIEFLRIANWARRKWLELCVTVFFLLSKEKDYTLENEDSSGRTFCERKRAWARQPNNDVLTVVLSLSVRHISSQICTHILLAYTHRYQLNQRSVLRIIFFVLVFRSGSTKSGPRGRQIFRFPWHFWCRAKMGKLEIEGEAKKKRLISICRLISPAKE